MSNYTKTTNFGAKDTLPSGDSQKIIRGTEFDTEFNNIATAVATKLEVDGSNNLAISGTFSSTKLIPTGGTATGNGMYLPAANAVAISTNGTERLRIDSSGVASFASNPILNGGTANGLVYLDGSKVATSGSAVTFDGTNLATTGTASATKLIPTGGTATGNGMYLPAANTLALSTNGTERVRVDSSGNLGVGTASPNTYGKLAVVGDGGTINLIAATDTTTTSVQHRLFNSSGTSVFRVIYYGASYASGSLFNIGANGTVLAQEANAPLGIGTIGVEQPLIFGTNSVERARIDSSGNLGLGVTPQAWGTTERALEVGVRGAIASISDGAFNVLANAYVNSSGQYVYRNTTFASRLEQISGQFRFFTASSGTAGNNISFTQAMTLDASGNLGVGSTAPVGYSGYSGVTIQNTNGGFINLRNAANTNQMEIAVEVGNTGYVKTVTSIPLIFGTNNTERARIDSSGNLGVGTASPTFKLHVVSSGTSVAQFTGQEYGQIRHSDGTRTLYTSVYNNLATLATESNTPLAFGTNNTERARIDASGNFGLGTSSPLTKLHISGSTTQTITVTCTGGSGVNLDLTATSTEAKIGTPNGVALLFSTSNIERARIKSTGQFRFVPLSADPAGAETGDVYYNSTSNKLKVYNGTAWVDLH